MSELVKAGLIERRRGSGTVVSRKMRQKLGQIGLVAPSALVEEAEVKVAVTPRAVDYTFKGEELHISRKCAHREAGTVGKRRERCSEGGVFFTRCENSPLHGFRRIWYNVRSYKPMAVLAERQCRQILRRHRKVLPQLFYKGAGCSFVTSMNRVTRGRSRWTM